jgi:HK97 gp10 family phage protein
MATTKVTVSGLDELLRNMRGLNNKVKTKIIRSAGVAGANVFKKAAIQNAPVKTGDLKAAISTRRSRKFSNTAQGYEQRDIGIFKVRGGKFANTKRNRALGRVGKSFEVEPPSFYWRFMEFGTVKFMPGVGLGFMRRAFDENKEHAKDVTVDKLKTEIEKATK